MSRLFAAMMATLITQPVSAQSLECDMLKEEIISQYRVLNSNSNQVQDNQQAAHERAMQIAKLSPEEQANYYGYQAGNSLGNGLAGAMESNKLKTDLQNNLSTYKQHCE